MLHLFSKNTETLHTLSVERKIALKKLCKKLQIRVKNLSLLDRALTHTSFLHRNKKIYQSYERLEFLGDSILNASVSHILYYTHPDFMEGKMSAIRSSVVDEKTLSEIGMNFGVDNYINLGKGEKLDDKRARQSVTADIIESIIAVLFLEGGFQNAFKFVKRIITPHLDKRYEQGLRDFKSKLQRMSLERFKEYPVYEVVGERGPEHNKIFDMKVRILDKYSAVASGRSKKEAEQKAAKEVIEQMTKKDSQ